MDDAAFDRALIGSVFDLIAARGVPGATIGEAARTAGLPLDQARRRFSGVGAVLKGFGSLADQAALGEIDLSGSTRDRLFGVVMRRIDFLQTHRAGVIALLRGLPRNPPLALLLGAATLRSMAWLLDGAGVGATGPIGVLRAEGLLAVWLWTIRAWQRDESADLSGTMAALDTALARAEQAAGWLPGRRDIQTADGAAADDAAEDELVREGLVEVDPIEADPVEDAMPVQTVMAVPPEPPASPPV